MERSVVKEKNSLEHLFRELLCFSSTPRATSIEYFLTTDLQTINLKELSSFVRFGAVDRRTSFLKNYF